jgi:hypothetical protein
MAEENPTAKASRFEPLSWLWRAFAAPQTLMLLLGLIALALMLASLIPQIPPQSLGDPQTWLAVQPGLLGSGNSLVRTLVLYDVYHAFWFRLLLVLTALALFVWLVDAADLAWQATRRKSWSPAAFAHWGHRAAQTRLFSALEQDDVLARLGEFLTQHGYRWVHVPDLPLPNLVAGHRTATLWSRPVALGAWLLALIGLATMGAWGWQGPEWQPAPGEILAVGHDTPYRVRLDSFEPEAGADGRLCNYQSRVTWLKGEEPVAQDQAANGWPATFQGIALRQVGFVPAVDLRVWDDAGRSLALQLPGIEQNVLNGMDVLFASPAAQPLVLIPARDLYLSFAFEPFGADGRPSLSVILLHTGETDAQLVGVLSESGTLTADGLRIGVALTYRPILQASHRPVMGLVLGGLSVGIAALVVGWLVPARLVWIAVAPGDEDESLIRLLAPPGAGRGEWLPQLAARLREALADDA